MKRKIISGCLFAVALLFLFSAAQGKIPDKAPSPSREVGANTCQLSGNLEGLLNNCEKSKPKCCAGQYACNLRDRYYNICNDRGEWREGGKLPQDLTQMDSGLKSKCDQAAPKCCDGQYSCNYRDRYFNVCENGEWRAGGQISEELMAFRSKCDWKHHLKK